MDARFDFVYHKALAAGIPRDKVLEAWNTYQARMLDRWIDSGGFPFVHTAALRQWWKYLFPNEDIPITLQHGPANPPPPPPTPSPGPSSISTQTANPPQAQQ